MYTLALTFYLDIAIHICRYGYHSYEWFLWFTLGALFTKCLCGTVFYDCYIAVRCSIGLPALVDMNC